VNGKVKGERGRGKELLRENAKKITLTQLQDIIE
jgi:hypothetical protein